MKSCTLAARAASSISCGVAGAAASVGFPYAMFSAIDVAKRVGSWLTIPMRLRRLARFHSLTSTPSRRTVPSWGS